MRFVDTLFGFEGQIFKTGTTNQKKKKKFLFFVSWSEHTQNALHECVHWFEKIGSEIPSNEYMTEWMNV